jgi:hypothetical protein
MTHPYRCSRFHHRHQSRLVASQLQVTPTTTSDTPSDRHSQRGTSMSHIARFFTPALIQLCWPMLVPSSSCRTPLSPHRVSSWYPGLSSCIPSILSHSFTLSPWPSPWSPCSLTTVPKITTSLHSSSPHVWATHPLLCPMPHPWPCSSLLLTSVSAILLDPPSLPYSSLILLRP